VLFVTQGLVDWRLALWMAAGAIVGGYAGAGTARAVQRSVRDISPKRKRGQTVANASLALRATVWS
jgi:hypothetical protein